MEVSILSLTTEVSVLLIAMLGYPITEVRKIETFETPVECHQEYMRLNDFSGATKAYACINPSGFEDLKAKLEVKPGTEKKE